MATLPSPYKHTNFFNRFNITHEKKRGDLIELMLKKLINNKIPSSTMVTFFVKPNFKEK